MSNTFQKTDIGECEARLPYGRREQCGVPVDLSQSGRLFLSELGCRLGSLIPSCPRLTKQEAGGASTENINMAKQRGSTESMGLAGFPTAGRPGLGPAISALQGPALG